MASAATATPGVCSLTPEMTEGPFYLPLDLVRKDITEGKAGIPLPLRITVMNATTCEPLANAAVDIWHCDAQGAYSGVTGENPGGLTRCNLFGEGMAGSNFADHFEGGWRRSDIGGPHRISIHRRDCGGRLCPQRGDILGEHASERAIERDHFAR